MPITKTKVQKRFRPEVVSYADAVLAIAGDRLKAGDKLVSQVMNLAYDVDRASRRAYECAVGMSERGMCAARAILEGDRPTSDPTMLAFDLVGALAAREAAAQALRAFLKLAEVDQEKVREHMEGQGLGDAVNCLAFLHVGAR